MELSHHRSYITIKNTDERSLLGDHPGRASPHRLEGKPISHDTCRREMESDEKPTVTELLQHPLEVLEEAARILRKRQDG